MVSAMVSIIHKTGLLKDKIVASAKLEGNQEVDHEHQEYKGLTYVSAEGLFYFL